MNLKATGGWEWHRNFELEPETLVFLEECELTGSSDQRQFGPSATLKLGIAWDKPEMLRGEAFGLSF